MPYAETRGTPTILDDSRRGGAAGPIALGRSRRRCAREHGYSDTSGFYLSQLNPSTYTYYNGRQHVDWPTTHGAVVGGGIQLGAGRLRFAPEIRYTHWNREVIQGSFADGPSYGS